MPYSLVVYPRSGARSTNVTRTTRHCALVSLTTSPLHLTTDQSNRPTPLLSVQFVELSNDGLRPKTYPPQRYLERADLTIFLYSMRAYFNHNISMRPVGQHHYNLQISRSPQKSQLPWRADLQRSSWPKAQPHFGVIRY